MKRLANVSWVLVLVSLLAWSSSARAQCPSWENGFGANGLDGPVYAMTVFDDGTGPALYVGGSFTMAGVVAANSIAKWNGSFWSPLGSGVGGGSNVKALAVYDDGSGPALYAGGYFDTAGGLAAGNIAKWDGTNWSPLGSGLDGNGSSTGHGHTQIAALTVFDDGSGPVLVAGGDFTVAGGGGTGPIAQWDGSTWSGLGGGLSIIFTTDMSVRVNAMAAFDDGSGPALCVAGNFDYAGGVVAFGTAKWDGSQWSALGGTVFGNVWTLTVFDDGAGPALFAGGEFDGTSAGSATAHNIAKWDGATWSALGGGLGGGANARVMALTEFDDGRGPALHAGGEFTTAGSVVVNGIAKWNGSTWSSLGSGVGGAGISVGALADFNDGSGRALYVGGDFTSAGGVNSNFIGAWSGCSGSGAGTPFCFGDGSGIACPCSNSGAVGHGCENSVTTGGAHLTGAGGASLALDTLRLTSSGELPTALSILLQGNSDLPNAVPFGDGLRCVGGALKRMYVNSASGGSVTAPAVGDPPVSARSAARGDPIHAGQARSYQVYYRDPNPNFCASPAGSGFNVSQALRILWAP